MKKRVLSLFLALTLCLTLLPTAAFAEGTNGSAISSEAAAAEGGQPTATGAPTEGGGQLTNTGEGEQPNSETDALTEIWCVSKPDSIGRSYDGTTNGSTIPIDLTFTDGTNSIILKEGTDFTAKKTFDSADAVIIPLLWSWNLSVMQQRSTSSGRAKKRLRSGAPSTRLIPI